MAQTKFARKKSLKNNFTRKEKTDNKSVDYLLSQLHVAANVYDYSLGKLLFVNDKFSDLIGLSKEECMTKTVDEFHKWIHPDDFVLIRNNILSRIREICSEIMTSSNYKIMYSFNYRLKDRIGKYRNVLNQSTVTKWDENKSPVVVINILTDLDHLRSESKIIFALKYYLPQEDKWEQITPEEFLHTPKMLTPRERVIMFQMIADKSATEIAELLGMNRYTVRSHWRNVLQKTGCATQKCLKDLARKEGWV